MKFGLAFAASIGTEPSSALEVCRVAEEVGFESVWGGEHVIFPSTIESAYPYTADGKVPATADTPIPDPLIWLAYVAAAAPTLRLGTCILILPQHSPVITAKQIATLDYMSGGRVLLGIGVGWLREEFEAIGVPFDDRGRRTDEGVRRGAQGAHGYLASGETVHAPAKSVEIVDTVGAGDTFNAGVLAKLAELGLLQKEKLASLSTEALAAALGYGARVAAGR